MKLKIEPERIKKLLESLMVKKWIDPVVLEFDETGITNRGCYSTAMGVYSKIEKKFFLEFETKKEVIAFTSSFQERFGWGFTDPDGVSIYSKASTLHMEGKRDKFEMPLESTEAKKLPWTFVLTDDGYLPDYNFDAEDRKSEKSSPGSGKFKKGSGKIKVYSSFKIDAKELALPPAKEYRFEYIDGELTVKIVGGGTFSRKLNGTAVEKRDIKFGLDSVLFSDIVSNLEGEILLVFDENMAIFAEKKKDCLKTYFLATNIEE
jgi:hypothetical protein